MLSKLISLLFAFILVSACGKSGGGSGSSAQSEVNVGEISNGAPLPNAALTFNVNLSLKDFNRDQEAKVYEAADLIKKVIASEEFKDKILNHTYNGKKTFVDNGGFSNSQIYKTILEGAEKLIPQRDNEMDLDLTIYKASNNTVGYTYPTEARIWMNAKYFNARSAAEATTNMMHEWLHKLGFKHSVKSTPSRKYTVPYAIGYLVARIAKKL